MQSSDGSAPSGWVRRNLWSLPLEAVQAHGGVGQIGFHRVVDEAGLSAACNFIDFAVVPPGASIGRHRHGPDEEELYLVLRGHGTMWRDGETFSVGPGDLIRNQPGGSHGLENTGHEPLAIFVIELPVKP